MPAALDGVVTAVLGLDTRPQAQPHFRTRADAAAAQGTSYPPNQVADIYQFPAGTTGAGQTVAVIELGGGFSTSDLDTYFGGLGIARPSITAASVDGAANNPGSTQRGRRRGQPGHRRHRRRRARRGAGGVLRAEQRRPGLRRRDLRRRAGQPGADRDLDQLGPVRGLLDRAGPVGDEPGDVRRGGARHHRVRGRGRQRQRRRRQRRPGALSTSPRPARTRWAAAGPSCWPTRPPAR